MSKTMLDSTSISAFCESIAALLSADIQVDEALSILEESSNDPQFVDMCATTHRAVAAGSTLSAALEATNLFPSHVITTIASGEESGRTENVLRKLAMYYSEEGRIFAKMRQSISYPAALLCVMTVIIAFTLVAILPVFANVYESFVGSLTTSSFSALSVSVAIGWAALIITAVCAIICVAASIMARSENGRRRLFHAFERLPMTRKPIYQLALSRFASSFATYASTGINTDDAMRCSLDLIEHEGVRAKMEQVHRSMTNLDHPMSLAQAIAENEAFETAYSRMLSIGSAAGNLSEVMGSLSDIFFNDAVGDIDRLIDNVEPIMAAFMTVAIAATLIAVMLPLVGIMGSLG